MKRLPLLCLAFSGACLAGPSDGLPTEQDYFGELPVVLSATRLQQSLEASPVAVSIIDREMIRASGARQIEELFRLVPGMIVGHQNGHNGFVTYHAMADRYARRMQVMIDGRTVYSPITGGVDWSTLPIALSDIERIEVVRGPNASAYGANAFLGAINIITRAPADRPGTGVVAEAGTDGIYRGTLRHARADGQLDWQFTASGWGDDGFVQPNGYEDDKDVRLLNARVDYRGADGLALSARAGGAQEQARTGNSAASILEPPHDSKTRRNFLQLELDRPLGETQDISLRYFQLRVDENEIFSTAPLPFLAGAQATIDRSIESLRRDLEFQHTWEPRQGGLRTVWGAAVRLDRLRSPSYFGSGDWIENRLYRLFGQAEWRPAEHWIAQAGLMLEKSGISGEDASPRLALNWLPDRTHAFRLSTSRAARTPVLLEARAQQRFSVGGFFDQVFAASGDLEAERITEWEIGYLGRYSNLGLTLDARLFRQDIEQLITYFLIPYPDPFNGVASDFRNYDSARIAGAEAQLDWRPDAASRIVFNYAWSEIESEDVDEIYSQSGPRHNASLLVSRELVPGLEASLGVYYMSRYHGLDTGDPIAATRRTDLRLAWSPRTLQDTSLSLVVQALNGEMIDFQSQNIFERRAYVRLETRF